MAAYLRVGQLPFLKQLAGADWTTASSLSLKTKTCEGPIVALRIQMAPAHNALRPELRIVIFGCH